MKYATLLAPQAPLRTCPGLVKAASSHQAKRLRQPRGQIEHLMDPSKLKSPRVNINEMMWDAEGGTALTFRQIA